MTKRLQKNKIVNRKYEITAKKRKGVVEKINKVDVYFKSFDCLERSKLSKETWMKMLRYTE